MAKFAGLLVWTDAWVADTYHLSRAERGTYFDLLVRMWRTPGCTVPNDDAWLAKNLRMTLDEVRNELRPIIAEFCETDGNRVWQKRLLHEFQETKKRSKSQSDRANARWKKEKDVCPDDAAPHASGNATGTERIGSVPKKKDAPSGAPKLDSGSLERDLYRRGKEVLGNNAGGLIAKLVKAKGSISQARAAIEQASEKQNPREFIGRIVNIRGSPDDGVWRTPAIPGIL